MSLVPPKYVLKAVVDRLVAASVAAGRVYTNIPQGTTYPFCLVSIEESDINSTMSFDAMTLTVHVQYFSLVSIADAIDGQTAINTALQRVALTLGSGSSHPLQLARVDAFREPDAAMNVYQAISIFRIATY